MDVFTHYPELEGQRENIQKAISLILEGYSKGAPLLVAGNGGSAADASHIVGELMKGFLEKRPLSGEQKAALSMYGETGKELASNLQRAIPAIDLTAQSAILTAFSNDVSARDAYAQLVNGYAVKGGVFLGITTSGNSENIYRAAIAAKAAGLKVVILTGAKGGKCEGTADVTIKAPACETYRVQEYHLPIYHYICAAAEEQAFSDADKKY